MFSMPFCTLLMEKEELFKSLYLVRFIILMPANFRKFERSSQLCIGIEQGIISSVASI